MGKQANLKELRSQLRLIVQEILPEVLTKEIENALYKALEGRVKDLEGHVKGVMKEMTERQKDTLGYLVRQATIPVDQDKK